MSVKLVYSGDPAKTCQRVTRVMVDCIALRELLTRAEAKSLYPEIEAARDALSKLLDRADGKRG